MSSTKPPSYDDRFVVPLEPSRRGAHRARTGPFASSLPVIAVLTTVAAVIALGWFLFGGQLLGGQDEDTTAGTKVTEPVATTAGQATQNPVTTEPSPSDPLVEVDRTVSVTVLNSTQTSGLARKAVTALQSDGWTKSEFAYEYAQPRTTTVVYYAESSQEDTAQALVDDLKVGEIEKSASLAADGIVVVLGTDYTG